MVKSLESDVQLMKKEKILLQNQLEDLKEENGQFFNHESKVKRLLEQNEQLKEINFNLGKENKYNEAKLVKLASEIEQLEGENRSLRREKKELED